MVQDFTIKGAHSTTIRQRVLQGITQHWKLAKNTQTNLLALYQLEGLSNQFFDELSKSLSDELDLGIVELLSQLGFEKQYQYSPKDNHWVVNKIFLQWLKFSFYNESIEDEKLVQRNIFLTKEALTELVDWTILCGYILSNEEVPSCYTNCRNELLNRAIKYCAALRSKELMEDFLIEIPLYQKLRENIRACLLDCFYWHIAQEQEQVQTIMVAVPSTAKQ
jgi:hypothetical protein